MLSSPAAWRLAAAKVCCCTSFSPSEWFGSAAVYPGNELLKDGTEGAIFAIPVRRGARRMLVRSGAGSDCFAALLTHCGVCAAPALSHRKTTGTYAQRRLRYLRHAADRF